MQEPHAEHNRWIALAWALLVLLATAFLVCGPLLGVPPEPEDYLRGTVVHEAHLLTLAATLAAGLATMLLVALPPVRRRAGSFGLVGATALAAGLVAFLVPLLPSLPARAALAILLAILLAPLLADRGLPSLCLTALLVGFPIALARRHALDVREGAMRFAALRDAVATRGLARCLVAADLHLSIPWRQALAISLRPPYLREPIDLACVAPGSDEEAALRAAGWEGCTLAPDGTSTPLAATAAQPHELAIHGSLTPQGPLAVLLPAARGRFVLHVVTPAGAVHQETTDPTSGLRLLGDAHAAYRALVAPLPRGMAIYLCVDSPTDGTLPARASDWVRLTLEGSVATRERAK